MRQFSLSIALLTLVGCASAPAASDWRTVALLERNAAGQTGLALPKELPGCTHLGMVRVAVPEGSVSAPFAGAPNELVDQLKQQAAGKGGNTLVVLPGMRTSGNALRGSVFDCPPT